MDFSYKKNKNLLKIEIFLSFLLLILTISRLSNIWTDTFAFVIYIISIYSLFIIDTNQIIKYFGFVFGSTWAIIAVFCLENLTVTVADDKSAHYGSFGTYVLAWMVYYITVIVVEQSRKRLNSFESEQYQKRIQLSKARFNTIRFIVLLGTILELFAFISIFTKPYFKFAIDRIEYANTTIPIWLNGHIGFFAVLIPLAVMIMEEDRLLSFLYITMYFILNLWVGEKFTGPFVGAYFFIFSYMGLYGYKLKIIKIRKLIYIMLTFSLLLLVVVYFQTKIIQGRDFGYYLTERISAQGYIWWRTYGEDYGNGLHLNEIRDELVPFYTHLSGRMVEYDFGIYKLMKLFYSTPSRWENMLEYGFRGTESTRATFYYYGKMPGLILGQIMLGLATVKITGICYKYLRKLDYIRVFFSFYILRNFMAIFSMSDFYLLVKPTMIISYLMLMFGRYFNINIRPQIPKIKMKKVKYFWN